MNRKWILFYSLLISVIVSTAVCKAAKEGDRPEEKPGSIAGNYSLKTDPNNKDYIAYLTAMEYGKEEQENQTRTETNFFVSWAKLNKTHWHVKRVTRSKTILFTFQAEQVFIGELPDGRMKPHSFTVDEEKRIAVKLIQMGDFNSTQELKFVKSGFNITMMAKEAKAVLEFTRINWDNQFGGVVKGGSKGGFSKGLLG